MSPSKNRLVVASTDWAETIPDWLRNAIADERMVYGLADLISPSYQAGEAEVCAYLYTLSLRQPMPAEYAAVYEFVTAQLMQSRKTELPSYLARRLETGLNEHEQQVLDELRRDLYGARGGPVDHPLLNALRDLKKGAAQSGRRRTDGDARG